MAKLSKRVRAFREKVDANQTYSLDDAIALFLNLYLYYVPLEKNKKAMPKPL